MNQALKNRMKKITNICGWIIMPLLIVSPFLELTRLYFELNSSSLPADNAVLSLENIWLTCVFFFNFKYFVILYIIGLCSLYNVWEYLDKSKPGEPQDLASSTIMLLYISASFIIVGMVLNLLLKLIGFLLENHTYWTISSALLLIAYILSSYFYRKNI